MTYGAATGSDNLVDHSLYFHGVQIRYRHMRAFVGEEQGGGPPHATSSSRHQRSASFNAAV